MVTLDDSDFSSADEKESSISVAEKHSQTSSSMGARLLDRASTNNKSSVKIRPSSGWMSTKKVGVDDRAIAIAKKQAEEEKRRRKGLAPLKPKGKKKRKGSWDSVEEDEGNWSEGEDEEMDGFIVESDDEEGDYSEHDESEEEVDSNEEDSEEDERRRRKKRKGEMKNEGKKSKTKSKSSKSGKDKPKTENATMRIDSSSSDEDGNVSDSGFDEEQTQTVKISAAAAVKQSATVSRFFPTAQSNASEKSAAQYAHTLVRNGSQSSDAIELDNSSTDDESPIKRHKGGAKKTIALDASDDDTNDEGGGDNDIMVVGFKPGKSKGKENNLPSKSKGKGKKAR